MVTQYFVAEPTCNVPSKLQSDVQFIREAIQAALVASGYRSVAGLDCDVIGETVVLTGKVSSFYLKQVAQEAVMQLKLKHRVHNAVQVWRG